jgi:hypothetical protein
MSIAFLRPIPQRIGSQINLRSLEMKKDTNLLATGLMLALALATMVGCAGTGKATQSTQAHQENAQHVLSGKVVETMNASGYTYVNLENEGKKVWVAVPTMAVKVGDELKLQPGTEMESFSSKTLNRTFDKIIFSSGPVMNSVEPTAALPAGHPTVPAASAEKGAAKPDAIVKAAEKPFYSGKVVETMNSGSYTYICLEKDGKKSWAAVPAMAVKVGEEIEVQPGTEMGRFTSKTLKKTFDNIIFSSGIVPKK